MDLSRQSSYQASQALARAPQAALQGLQVLDEQQAQLQLISRMRDELDQSLRSIHGRGYGLTTPMLTPTGAGFSTGLSHQLQPHNSTSNIDDIQLAHLNQQIQQLAALQHLGAPAQHAQRPTIGSSALHAGPEGAATPTTLPRHTLEQTPQRPADAAHQERPETAQPQHDETSKNMVDSTLNLSEIRQ